MQSQWKKLLEDSGAVFTDNQLTSFGHSDQERKIPPQGNIICDLSGYYGLIHVEGDDATEFLQNQLTNDIHQATESSAQLSAWCNPKGRTIATFLIHKSQSGYYLSLSADLLEYVLKRLQMYVMRSQVTLQDVGQTVAHFGFSGAKILEDWEACCDKTLPTNDYDTIAAENLHIIKLPGSVPRYEVMGNYKDASHLWRKLSNRATPVSADAWHYLNIASGIPVVTQASQEAWIPQMLNLQLIDGVNFKKGCFPGQEVVARLKYLGKNKRRMFRLEFATDKVPEVGELIIAKGEKAEAGKILNAVLNPNSNVEALAILKIAMVDVPLFLDDEQGASATILELPYSLEAE